MMLLRDLHKVGLRGRMPMFIQNFLSNRVFRVRLGSVFSNIHRGHGGRVVTFSPPTSEAGVRFPARPQVGKLVVACRWSAVYSTEP